MSTITITRGRMSNDPVSQRQWDDFCWQHGLELDGDGAYFLADGVKAGCERETATFEGDRVARVAIEAWLKFGGRMSCGPAAWAEITSVLSELACIAGNEKVSLVSFGWGHKLHAWVAWTRFDVVPLSALTGRTVNLGGKNGGIYEGVTVTAVDNRTGKITVEGGSSVSCWPRDDELKPLAGPASIYVNDIARGYVHPRTPS